MTDKYAVVDSTGIIVNMVKWDGATPFNPGEGLLLIKYGEGYVIGGTLVDGVYTPPIVNEE